MPSDMSDLKKEIGIQCLGCGRSELPPNREVDNWTCGYCHSGFVSIPMLSNLLPRDVMAQILSQGTASAKSKPCPRCHKPMETSRAAGQGDHVEIERCGKCHLVWFEAGRMTRLANLRPLDKLRQKALDELMNPKLVGVRRPKAEAAPTVVGPLFVPWYTLGLFAGLAVLLYVPLQAPQWLPAVGFLPASPLRGMGLPWLTSLFLNSGAQTHVLVPLLVLGSLAEHRLGGERILWLFVAAGVTSRLVYVLMGATALTFGSTEAAIGVMAYALFTIPYLEFLFPSERWRSPMNGILWTIVGVGFVISLILSWNYFYGAFRAVVVQTDGASPGGTLLGEVGSWVAGIVFRAHAAAALVGVGWFMVELVLRNSDPNPKP